MTLSSSRFKNVGLSVVAVTAVFYLAFSKSFYEEAMVDAFFALELGSILILLLRLSFKWSNVGAVGVLVLAISFVDLRLLHYQRSVMVWFSFVGLASFLILLLRLIWQKDRRLLSYGAATAFLFALSEYCASNFLDMTAAAHPKTLDIYLMMFDASLRFQPAFLFGQIYAAYAWVHTPTLIAYISLAVPLMMVYSGRLVRFGKKSSTAALAFLVTGPLGVIFYNIFPAAGPHNLFGHKFPFAPLPYDKLMRVVLEPVTILGPRNAMPSLHLAWTLLAWWYSRGLSWIERSIVFAFLALTAFATMGTGEHWFADLVVAFPFALLVQAACSYDLPMSNRQRREAFMFGLIATATWLVFLRYCPSLFWSSPLVPWSLSIATFVLTALRQRALQSAVTAERSEPVKIDSGADQLPGHSVIETFQTS